MEFLLLLPRRARVVLEVDGKHHYTEDGFDRSSPRKYAEMVRADRQVRLEGYDVYRFGGQEFTPLSSAAPVLEVFFDALLDRHVGDCGCAPRTL
jgi:hypothetical protein